MSDGLDFLRADDEDAIGKLAEHLVHEDNELHYQLVTHRLESGLSRETVAERLGVSVETVAKFEAYWYDPRLSELRRYALAIGLSYSHVVDKF